MHLGRHAGLQGHIDSQLYSLLVVLKNKRQDLDRSSFPTRLFDWMLQQRFKRLREVRPRGRRLASGASGKALEPDQPAGSNPQNVQNYDHDMTKQMNETWLRCQDYGTVYKIMDTRAPYVHLNEQKVTKCPAREAIHA